MDLLCAIVDVKCLSPWAEIAPSLLVVSPTKASSTPNLETILEGTEEHEDD
ncbi:hypothetical protein ACHQM5_013350 [Ranunculus cassubicifolius]